MYNHVRRHLSQITPKPTITTTCTPLSHLSTCTVTDYLPIFTTLKSLAQTKQSHAHALTLGLLPSSISLCAPLILHYAKFSHPKASRLLFETSLPFSKTPFLWNTLLRAYATNVVFDVFQVYNCMVRCRVRPDDHTFAPVIKACGDHLMVKKGREVHGVVIKVGFDGNVFVGNTLLRFYSCCGEFGFGNKVFDEMPVRDVVSWNTLIGGCVSNGFRDEAVRVFFEMMVGGRSGVLLPNVASVVSVLPGCAEGRDLTVGRVIHGYVVKVGLVCFVKVSNALIDLYGKCGEVESSRRVFDEASERNVVSWNAIITGFAHVGCFDGALRMFRLMVDAKERPDDVTLSSMLPVLVELEFFNAGREIHGLSVKTGLCSDLFISNSLIDMYAKSGQSEKACSIFHEMSVRNVVTWNAMVANFAQNHQELAALELVRLMQTDGEEPNAVTFTNVLPACARLSAITSGKEIHARCIRTGVSLDNFISNGLMDMYAKSSQVDLAQNVFDISHKDQISYNTLIGGYSQTAACMKSLDLFKEMRVKGLQYDTVSFVGAISACANFTALKPGREIHGFVIRRLIHRHLFIANSLLDLYMKCGKINQAQILFDGIDQRDVASWNTMILGYGMLGEFETAIFLFEAMREDTAVDYDSVSFIAVLSACSHGGLVDKGKKYFEEMKNKGLRPTSMHYTCMVDLLGRAGLMDEALELIRELPFEPDSNIWGALLGASRIHGNIEMAKLAAEHLFLLKPEHSGYYVQLSNMLSEAGRWDEASKVRELMKSKGVKKDPAYSWVLRGQVRTFVVGESAVGS